jgi:hypothetical protein
LEKGRQELAPVGEFAKKIEACKDALIDPDFQVNYLSQSILYYF